VRDVLYILQGIDGKDIKFTARGEDSYSLHVSVTLLAFLSSIFVILLFLARILFVHRLPDFLPACVSRGRILKNSIST
jgi:hypothetical protein